MKLLTNKTFVTATNNWFAPTCEFHEKHRSIMQMVPMDQSSSAGDWTGFLIQRTGQHTAHCIGYEQVNNYPGAGFTLYTADYPFYKGDPTKPGFVEDAKNCWMQFAYDKEGNLNY